MRGTAYIYMRGNYTNNFAFPFRFGKQPLTFIVCREKYLSLFHNQSFDTLMISEHRQVSTSSNKKQIEADTRDNYVINKASMMKGSGGGIPTVAGNQKTIKHKRRTCVWIIAIILPISTAKAQSGGKRERKLSA